MSGIPFPALAPAVRFLAGGTIALCACDGADLTVAVDQPGRWYDLGVSHHDEHAVGGVALGALGYGAAALVTDHSGRRIACGVALGLAVGVGYEVAMASHGHDGTIADPIDAAYVTAGALAGAVVADLAGRAIDLAITPRSAAIAVAWRF